MTISKGLFHDLTTLVKDETAIVIDESKEYLVESRLSPLVRKEGFSSLQELLETLLRTRSTLLKERILNALTTNETSFFRDSGAFIALKNVIIPELIKARRATQTLTFWSAACSTGQEAYSLAILIREHFPELQHWKVVIRASDINSNVLVRARTGEYSSLEVGRGLSEPLLETYFDRTGGVFKVKSSIMNMVEFFQLNLINAWPTTPIDVMLLRNVLIYFDQDTKVQLFRKTRRVLRSDGILVLGAAETARGIDDTLRRRPECGTGIYQIDPEAR
jgi:chemotaxis protein methyltransferase CheR